MRLVIFLIAVTALAQKPDVSVKASTAQGKSSSWSSKDGVLEARNVTLRTAIASAYGVSERDVYGPASIDADRFDIDMKAPGVTANAELMGILRGVLTERFHMAVHTENRERAGYALTIGASGLKLKEVDPGAGPRTNTTNGRLVAERATLTRIADVLSHLFDIPIMDATGVKGTFDATIEWAASQRLSAEGDAPSLVRALEAAGLKLERRMVAVASIVVDRVE